MTRDEAKRLLDCCWGPRARRSEESHYVVATNFSQRNRRLSYAIVVLATLTGSSLFGTISKQHPNYQVALAVLSILTAIIAGYQRSTQYAALAVEHQRAGADWGEIVNRTEILWAQLESRDPTDAEMDRIRTEMDSVTKKSPQIPKKFFKQHKVAETYMFDRSHGAEKHP